MEAREGKQLPKGTQFTTNGLDFWIPSLGLLLAILPSRLSLLAHYFEHPVTSDLNTYHQLFAQSLRETSNSKLARMRRTESIA